MYESYYGLTSKPFQLNPDPNFYFGSKQHRRATAYLEYGLHQNEGFIVVTGEVGAGKTTIVRGLLSKLDSAKVVAAQLVSTQLDADDTLRMVAAAFGVRTKNLGKSDVLLALEAFLVDVTRQGKRCLLIVDEAQNLTPHAVEELRMLSNFQFETQALLQSFLIGQAGVPQHHAKSAHAAVAAARHRGRAISVRWIRTRRTGMSSIASNVPATAVRRCSTTDAYIALFKASGGVPRRINSLCDRILLSGFLGGKTEFGAADVNEVAKELNEETLAPGLVPQDPPGVVESRGHDTRMTDTAIMDLNLARLELDSQTADETMHAITDLKHGINEQRIVRLERSMIRIERSTAATLTLLQQLVNSIRVRQADKEGQA